MTYSADMPIPFAGGKIDYAEDRRNSEDLSKFVALPSARCLLLHHGRIGVGEGKKPHLVHPSELIGLSLYDPGPIFLGLKDDRPMFAASLQKPEDLLAEDNFLEVRALGGRLAAEDLAHVGRARSLFEWHRTHRFCANCGGGTHATEGGAKRLCPKCETEHFPRVNPVVIMLVVDGDRLLLGRGPGWPEGYYSALAGFVSPGESPEEAVARETMEEAGIQTTNHRYLFSQPWPFPSQLMMGMICDAATTDITIDPKELQDAKWFTRAEIAAVFDKTGEAFKRPPRATIAHQLMMYWLGETA